MPGRDACLNHLAHDRDPEALAEQKRRNTAAVAAVEARAAQARAPGCVSLATVAEIRQYISRLAHQVEVGPGIELAQRAKAGADLARLALELRKSEVEEQAKELAALLEANPHLRRKLSSVAK